MTDFTPAFHSADSTDVSLADSSTSLTLTPASAVAAAAQLAPRLLAQAALTDEVGGFPTQEMHWLRQAGLLTAVLPVALGGAGLGEPTATAAQPGSRAPV